jgi:hypothetical protein
MERFGGYYLSSSGYRVCVSYREAQTLELLTDIESRRDCFVGDTVDRFMRKAKALVDACERVGKWKADNRLPY